MTLPTLAQTTAAQPEHNNNSLEFNRFLAHLPVAAYTCNAEGLITYLNERAVELWGREPNRNDSIDRFCGSFKLFSADGTPVPHDECWMALALRNRKAYNGQEIVIERPDGSRGIGLAHANPLIDERGELLGAINIVVDITDRRRGELASAQLAAIVDSTDDAIVGKDLNGIVQSWNGAAERLFGYSAEQAVGRHISFLIPPDRADEEDLILRRLRAGERVRHFDTVRLRSDGRPVDVSLTISPIRDQDGRIVGASKIARDITDRRRGELARAQMAAIVDSSDDAIVGKDLNGIVQSWNSAATRLFGYSAEQAVGRHISFLIPPDRTDEEDHIITRLRAGERIYHFDTIRLRSDGKPIDVSLTISPIRDHDGRIVGASKIVRDIADRKEDENRIYRLVTQLKEADRRKDNFLAVLAHELRNPLAPLSNLLEIMRQGGGNGNLIERVQSTLERQLGHLVRMVDDLLDVSRIARDKLAIRKESVELRSLLEQAVEVFRPVAVQAKHELIVALPAEPIYLHADSVRLTQVFGNLISNACRYTEPGGRIWLTAERESNEAVVKVKDTGIGIPPDKLSSVFEMFSQIDRPLERSRGGLGIGLTLVKRLVEIHGGSVEVFSEGQGRGSEFVVRLPVALETSQVKTIAPTAAQTPTTVRRVLIVDDNRDAAESLAELLNIADMETQTAHDGLEAVASAEAFRPNVVLLDIGLPKLNGYDVCRRIREQAWGKKMVLVALTGWGQEEDRRQSKDAGFDQHMIKPVDYEALMKVLASS